MPVTLIRGEHDASAALAAEFGTVSAVCAVGDAEGGRFAWGALLGAAASEPAWLVTARVTPAALSPPPDLADATAAALSAGKIKVLRHQLGRPTPAQIRGMLAEFDFFAPSPHSLMVIDCGDHWFDQVSRRGRAPLVESLRQWAVRRRIAVVLLFHAPAVRTIDRATELLAFSRHLGGIARLARESRRTPAPPAPPAPPATSADDSATPLRCRLLFWFGATMRADATLTLAKGADGMLHAVTDARVRAARQAPTDAGRVVAQRSVLAGSGGAPQHWVLCDTLGEVLAACAGAVAATVMLTFERTTPPDALMQAVYQLRQMAGGQLKIIVRELHVRMRYNEDALIARLGANLIVPMEVSYARFLSMMEMVQSQVFSASLPPTFEAALENGLPDQALGYLAPAAFARAVSDALARSRTLAIDNVLVRLTLANGLTPLDAMRHCSLKRAGDLFTADRKTVLVFLFACREMDATQTLERIFALPIGELFGSEHRYIANLAAQSAIEEFGQRASGGRLPDLSDELQRIAGLRAPLPPTGPAASVTFTANGLVAVTRAATPSVTSAATHALPPATTRAGAIAPVHTPLRLRSAGEARRTQADGLLPTES